MVIGVLWVKRGKMDQAVMTGVRSRAATIVLAIAGCVGLPLSGCGAGSTLPDKAPVRMETSGVLHGGQQPISGAKIQLYAVSTAGDGLSSLPLLSSPAMTDQNGWFRLGSYTCPAANSLVYLVALGGNPGLGNGAVNNAAGLMAALGPCGALNTSTYIAVNEVTTVASVWPLAAFMSSYKAIGSGSADAEELANGFTLANELADMSTGASPGSSLPAGSSVPTSTLNTLANIIAACINSGGGVSGDGTSCGELFSYVKGSGPAPTNTIDAVLDIAKNPGANVSNLLNLSPPVVVFWPSLAAAPSAWSLAVTSPAPSTATTFDLAGLISPAVVAESVFVMAPNLPAGTSVSYYLDDQLVTTEAVTPFWMGGVAGGAVPYGFATGSAGSGSHTLRAVATLPDGSLSASGAIDLKIVPSLNSKLSDYLRPYLNQTSAQANSLSTLLAHTMTPGAALSSQELQTRQQVMAMYINWGIDPSLDYGNDQSKVLSSLSPAGWTPAAAATASTSPSMLFSSDAPSYQTIPGNWPRVALPSGYIKTVQLNTGPDGDGIGYGEVTASAPDPQLPVRSQWYNQVSTLKVYPYRMPPNWKAGLPANKYGDSHMIFIDPASNSFVSSYKTTNDATSGGPDALYASSPTPLGTLGDAGASTASNFAELPVLLQPGEATNASQPIPHALGGPVSRTWAARVYPASAWDSGVLTSTNTCTGKGYTNTGLVPYGGVIQLDPALDLTKLKLTLPAMRILQAIQVHGYYVMDFGCADLDIYTAVSEKEFEPYGGLWGNSNGIGVQNEIQSVLTTNKLYVVPPLTKKQ